MFIWDFVADTVLGQIVDWVYGQIIGFLGNFFSMMGQMGASFELDWYRPLSCFPIWPGRFMRSVWWWLCLNAR